MKPHELDALIDDCLEGRLSEAGAAGLSAALQSSPQARSRYWESAAVHGLLEQVMQQASVRAVTGQASARSTRRLPVHPVAAAAVGIAIGMLCTSLVMAYIAPPAETTVLMLNDGFEEHAGRWARDFPKQTGEWGGDQGEVVSGTGDVRPLEGLHMARLDPSPAATLSYLERVLDLQSLPVTEANDVRHVTVTASFHAAERGGRDRYTLRLAAFAEAPADVRERWVGREWRDMEGALATSKRALSTKTDAEGWQTLTAIIEIPRDARSLVISLGSGCFESPDRKTAHYVDGVQATLSIGARPPHAKIKRHNPRAP
jgi:hypothetical protein